MINEDKVRAKLKTLSPEQIRIVMRVNETRAKELSMLYEISKSEQQLIQDGYLSIDEGEYVLSCIEDLLDALMHHVEFFND